MQGGSARKAVILARGLGTRMRQADAAGSAAAGIDAEVDAAQAAAADSGLKGMIPFRRPFLDYIISGLADAGIDTVCMVIGPEHDRIRDYYSSMRPARVTIEFAIQQQPLGTADAVLAAETFADGEYVLVVNADNYYPVYTLRGLRELADNRIAGVAAFDCDALAQLGNISADRIAKYSVVEFDAEGMLTRITEKPDVSIVTSHEGVVYAGMNSWCLPPRIYDACRAITPSIRGELELASAVQLARDELGIPFRVLTYADAVLDLSSRADIPAVAARLRDIEPAI